MSIPVMIYFHIKGLIDSSFYTSDNEHTFNRLVTNSQPFKAKNVINDGLFV